MDFITENILLIITFVGSAILLAFPSLSKSKNSGLSPAEVVIQVNDKDAQLVAENIAQQLENRISFRRAMKSCMSRTMKSGALGVKTSVSGRLGGADMARTEFYSEGTIPLQTLRADIDYGFALTSHKAQGSTYKNVFVDINDMVFDKNGHPYTNADDLLRRLYVACSRASDFLVLNYG